MRTAKKAKYTKVEGVNIDGKGESKLPKEEGVVLGRRGAKKALGELSKLLMEQGGKLFNRGKTDAAKTEAKAPDPKALNAKPAGATGDANIIEKGATIIRRAKKSMGGKKTSIG